MSKVRALKRTTEVVEHREGGDPSSTRKSPGRSKYEPITLERGVTHDVEFEQWANKVKKPPRCLEYVFVHELVHLKEDRHSERFQLLMDEGMPQWRTHRDELNQSPLAHEDWIY